MPLLHTLTTPSHISCLDTHDKKLILTGCEDGSTRLWDIRDDHYRSVKCFKTSQEVSNVKFSPLNDNHIYVSCGTQIHLFDLRVDRVIVSDPVSTLAIPSQQESDDNNDINCITFSCDKKRMLICDDAGMVHCVTLEELQVGKIERSVQAHENICMSAVMIRKDTHMLTGGMDYKVTLHNLESKKKPVVWSLPFNQQQPVPKQQQKNVNAQQLVNPPLVQCMNVHPNNENKVVVGLANGKCALLDTNKDLSKLIVGSLDAHDYIVNQVEFVPSDNSKTLLFTCGYDNKIHLWDVQPIYKPPTVTTRKNNNKQKKPKQKSPPPHKTLWSQAFPDIKDGPRISCFKPIPSNNTVIIAYGDRAGIFKWDQ